MIFISLICGNYCYRPNYDAVMMMLCKLHRYMTQMKIKCELIIPIIIEHVPIDHDVATANA